MPRTTTHTQPHTAPRLTRQQTQWVNSPSISSWDFAPRPLRLLKKFEASACFMKIFFSGPAVGSRWRFSLQHKMDEERAMKKRRRWCQLLTLWIFCAACAARHSCRLGLWRPYRTKCEGSKSKHMYSKLHAYEEGKNITSIILHRTHRKVPEAQWGEPAGSHMSRTSSALCLDLLRDMSNVEDQEGEVSMWEVGWKPAGILAACQRRGRESRWRSDKRLNPKNSSEGFSVRKLLMISWTCEGLFL